MSNELEQLVEGIQRRRGENPSGGGQRPSTASTRRAGSPPASASPACSTRARRSSSWACGPPGACTTTGAAPRRPASSPASARVAGRRVMVIANDATVKAGAFFPMTCKKVLRAQRIALENRLPLVYLVDSAGVFLPLQDEVFPDEDDFGRIFRNNAVISAAGVPQFAAILGNCVAGGGYLPVLCDKLLMTEGSGLYLAGPALVKAAIGQTVSHEELGGAAMHAAISGTIDFREPDDAACLERLRRLVGAAARRLPLRRRRRRAGPAAGRPAATCSGRDPRQEYDVRDLLPCILDAGPFDEYKAEYGQTLVCGYGRLGGVRGRRRGQPAQALPAGERAAAVRRRHLRGQRRQGGPLHHGLQPDAGCRCCSCRTSTASWSAATRSRPASSGPGPSWSTSSPTASCRS